MHTHTSPDPVGVLQVAIYAHGVFHLNTWKMKSLRNNRLESKIVNLTTDVNGAKKEGERVLKEKLREQRAED